LTKLFYYVTIVPYGTEFRNQSGGIEMVGIVITMVILAAMAMAGFVQKFNPDRSSK
jgi:hypothetical protein